MDQTSQTESAAPAPVVAQPPPGGARPGSFRELLLTACWNIYSDLHVNVSGAVLFAMAVVAILHPELKDQCAQIANSAAFYLFGSVKRK